MLKQSQSIRIVVAMIFVMIIISVGVLIFQKQNKKTSLRENELTVVASFYPLAHFSQQVIGDLGSVINITPTGEESHDFEPTPRQIGEIYQSKLFIYNGANFDPWAEKVASEVIKSGVKKLEITKYLKTLQRNAVVDPHFWLDPTAAQDAVEAIQDAAIILQPENTMQINAQADAYIQKLQILDRTYQEELKNCKQRTIVVSHDAFAYLAKRYNINVISINGVTPEEEPTLSKLAEISQLIKKENIQYIFFEPLATPKLAQTIAQETGAQTLGLNPIEGLTEKEIKQGKDYITLMQENLVNLKTAMVCQ